MRATRLITAVEAHAEGEPGRIITGGLPHIPGDTMFAKMQWMQQNLDEVRTLMLREPRGYPALCCNALVPPCHPGADMGLVIMEQAEYPPMSGSNVICATTVLLETGILPMREPVTEVKLDTPAGLIRLRADCRDGKVTRVSFRNVPAFAVHLDASLNLPGHGPVTVDIAWGGMFFVIADATQFDLDPTAENGAEVVRLSERLRAAAADQLPVTHPDNPEITGPTISQLTAPSIAAGSNGRSAVTLWTGHPGGGVLDRSPCGTGTCAKMAVLHAKGLLQPGQDYVNSGPLGTTFTGRIVEETQIGTYPAIVPTLSGQGWIYGTTNWTLDPSDPFQNGYTIGDLWS